MHRHGPAGVHDRDPETSQQVVIGRCQGRRRFRHEQVTADRQRQAAQDQQSETPIGTRAYAALENEPGSCDQGDAGADENQLRPNRQRLAAFTRRRQRQVGFIYGQAQQENRGQQHCRQHAAADDDFGAGIRAEAPDYKRERCHRGQESDQHPVAGFVNGWAGEALAELLHEQVERHILSADLARDQHDDRNELEEPVGRQQRGIAADNAGQQRNGRSADI